MEHYLLSVANIQNSLSFVNFEADWHVDLPLGGLLADISDHHGLLGLVFDGDESKVELVWEVEHCTAASGPNGHYEFLSFCHNHQIVGII